jgi:hypothetical protein
MVATALSHAIVRRETRDYFIAITVFGLPPSATQRAGIPVLCELECIGELLIKHRRRSIIQTSPTAMRRMRLGLRTARFGALPARRNRNLDDISVSLSDEPCVM